MDAKVVDQYSKEISSTPLNCSGSQGIWLFVFIDMLVYGLIFMVYLLERSGSYEVYSQSQMTLNKEVGLINTIILLSSSWCMVRAVKSVRYGSVSQTKLYMRLALFGAILFCSLKVFEYYLKFDSGVDIISNPFFTFYFFMTFVHLTHVIAGMVFILVISNGLNDKNILSIGTRKSVENIALFWHYVDVLWLYIFALLYLVV
ncbi:cytochrome c oxidase subunit 3 [Zhongshania sp.]|jgi:nitric oxide reductase NorE protein|uniref:cytochrome c oxidase subunit 3 n=1 Tax=Zhongshania sp. TaxID=1971902 RepID=UPI002A8358DD|nr:cytochrome c oxidase subunit 3 [Zhongshania sp.]